MPLHDMYGKPVYEVRADADITMRGHDGVYTIEFSDPGKTFGKTKPDFKLIITYEKFYELLGQANVGFILRDFDPHPHI